MRDIYETVFFSFSFQPQGISGMNLSSSTYLSLHIKGNAEEQRTIEAHLQDIIPVLRFQHGLHRDRDRFHLMNEMNLLLNYSSMPEQITTRMIRKLNIKSLAL